MGTSSALFLALPDLAIPKLPCRQFVPQAPDIKCGFLETHHLVASVIDLTVRLQAQSCSTFVWAGLSFRQIGNAQAVISPTQAASV